MNPGKYSGVERLRFQDPAMDRWTTIQSYNESDTMMARTKDNINRQVSILFSTALATLSGYFLARGNWPLMLLMFIFIELITIFYITKHISILNEFRKRKREIASVCKQFGINVPKGKR